MSSPSSPKDYSATIVAPTPIKILEDAAAQLHMSVQPNPSSGLYQLTFELPHKEQASILIVDIATGQLLKTIAYKAFAGKILNTVSVDISDFAAGSYLLYYEGEMNKAGKVLIKR